MLMAVSAWSMNLSKNEVTRVSDIAAADTRVGSLDLSGNGPIKALPVSFLYGGKPSAEWLAGCQFKRSSKMLDKNRRQHTLIYTDRATGLVMSCVAVEYLDFPTVEWTLHFRNCGTSDTPIIENIQALDMRIDQSADINKGYVLHHNNGTLVTTINVPAGIRDYEPLTTDLTPGKKLAFIPPQGRPCAGEWPYYNLAWKGGGAIIVVGWPGAWAARFERDGANGLHVTAGQQKTHFLLHPQEEVRTPLIVIQQYEGDWIDGQNMWRQWMFAHNMPRPGGKLPKPMTGAIDLFYFPNLMISEKGENQFIDRYAEERLLPDCWWVDAGWYEMTDEKGESSYTFTGTWEIDKKRFPNGLRGVFDHAKSKGIGQGILWFEPERVAPKRWLYTERPQWLLGREGEYKLLNMGNPEALAWVTDMVDKAMNDGGFLIYREDYNFGPLDCWSYQEPENRQGINEIKHVTGHLAFWKEILRRNPKRMIDTCASGGHRLDIETLRLSVPLWRTDYPFDPVAQQGQTYGLSMWVPYNGTGIANDDAYTVRSDMTPFFLMAWDMNRKDQDYAGLRKLVTEWRKITDYYSGDFYPLTSYSVANTDWMAWQFHRRDKDAGSVQVFRRADSPHDGAEFRLKGLDVQAEYRVTDLDTGKSVVKSGKELTEVGLAVTMNTKPCATTFVYTKRGNRT